MNWKILTQDLSLFICRRENAVGSLISGIFGIGQASMNKNTTELTNRSNRSMNDATNSTNKKIQDSINQTQLQIHQDDMNFNAEQAQIQREWDSAASQRERLVAAGYNPLLVGNGAFGSSGSAASAPAAPSLDAAVMNPIKDAPPYFEGLEAIGQAMGLLEKQEDVRSKQIKNEFDPALFASEIEYKEAMIKNVTELTKQTSENLKWLPKNNLMKWRISQIQEKLFKQQYDEMVQTFETRKDQLSWAAKLSEQNWKNLGAEYDKIKKEVENLDAQSLVLKAQEKHILKETEVLNDLSPAQLALLKSQIISSDLQSFMRGLSIPPAFRGGLADVLSKYPDATNGLLNGFKSTKWYSEPNEYVKALLYAVGLFKGTINLEDALMQFETSPLSSGASSVGLPLNDNSGNVPR